MAKKKWPRLGGMDDGTKGEHVDMNGQSWPPAPEGVESTSSGQKSTRFSILSIGCMIIAVLFVCWLLWNLFGKATSHLRA
jgi:hypothetical protein